MGDDWQRSTDETNAQVDGALDAMGAPDYTPPAPETRGSFGERAESPGTIYFDTQRSDGSTTHEWINPGLDYHEQTQHADGTTSHHNVGPDESESGSTINWPGTQFPEHDQSDTYNYQTGLTQHRDVEYPEPGPVTSEDLAPLSDL